MRQTAGILNVVKLQCPVSALDIAVKYYKDHSRIDFFADLANHLRTGVVVVRPSCFFMGKLIWVRPRGKDKDEPAWFVTFGAGDLRELLTCLPFHLEWIAFCRHANATTMHIWPLKRVRDLINRKREER